jgi:D-alanyl-D-alanine carboxypeptidase/D-alanyl-D-alanine-endopeptidase (penicillin-binding protein 4)
MRPIFLDAVRPGPNNASVLARRPLLGFLAAFVAALSVAASAGAEGLGLSTRLAQALAVPHVDHARESVLAVDLETGKVVFARNAARALLPASNAKVPVTYAALVAFGPAYRIRTEVYAAGRDLVLKGYGDPTLSGADLQVLAARVRTAGVESVRHVVADETFFDTARTAPGWKPGFYIEESPPLSALVAERAKTNGYTSGDPALHAASLFRAALARAGVAVTGKVRPGRATGDAEPIAVVFSPPMVALVREVNTDSDNFTAELLLKQLGALTQVPGTSGSGSRVVREILAAAAVPLDGLRIADGSGLSLLDRMSARTLVGILEAAWLHPDLRQPFRRTLAVAGRTGTLEDRMQGGPAWGAVFAKTGTTNAASSLAGYVGDRYAFAILQNGSPVSTWWARRAQDRFAHALARS